MATNLVVLDGNLTKDPELKVTSGAGNSVCNFIIGVGRDYKSPQGARESDFIPVVVWKAQAEACAKNLQKGSRVIVEGRWQTRSYDAADGSKRYVSEVVATRVRFITSRTTSRNPGDEPEEVGGPVGAAYSSGPTSPTPMQEVDEDFPF